MAAAPLCPPDTERSLLEGRIKAEGARLGLAGVRIARLEDDAQLADRLRLFLADGRHGDMEWMAATEERRQSPLTLWPEARSAIVAGLSYRPEADPLAALRETRRGVISVYAQGKDYHDVLKWRLKTLARLVAAETKAEVKVFVDTAPIMEKPLAQKAGLGWQGKHTNLVSRSGGSWLFLGAIVTTAALEPDPPERDHCGRCRRCLDVCPTAAFPAPYQLDARRCIAYLTIEHRGHIDRSFRRAIGNRVFGCDDCLAVCPWNKFARQAKDQELALKGDTANPELSELLSLDDRAFRTKFAGTPVKRTGRDRIIRNALIAAGNARDKDLAPLVARHLDDPAPIVRAMAVWALGEIEDREAFDALRRQRLPLETDRDVLGEWLEGGA